MRNTIDIFFFRIDFLSRVCYVNEPYLMNEQKLTVLGEAPLALDSGGKLRSRIGTLFVDDRVLITLPRMTHAMQRLHYLGLHPSVKIDDLEDAVDLIMGEASVLIRQDPSRANMAVAFEADELLQTIVPKQNIRFLHARNACVQEEIRRRGEYWRISPRPQEDAEVVSAIEQSKIAIGGLPLYYYSPNTGTRHLTVQAFRELGRLETEPLRQHLAEIQKYLAGRNRLAKPEVALFGLKPGSAFGADTFKQYDFASADAGQLRALHRELCAAFEGAAEENLQCDDVKNEFWRNRMFACLMDEHNDTLAEKLVSGLTEEFFRQIEWLPGGRIDKGGLMFDSVFDDPDARQSGLCDLRVRDFIFNYVREFGDLEYVNIGRLLPGLRKRQAPGAHRAYIAEVKHRNAPKPLLRILRMQKWGIAGRLEADRKHRNLLRAIMETQDYTEYTLDRRSGCWQLGMPLPKRIDVRTIPEDYLWEEDGNSSVIRIWATYYERDFIEGLATDKITKAQLGNASFALRLAEWLGFAAAPNLVVGRMTTDNQEAVFDQGDEILRLDESGLPCEILVADCAGTFVDYESPLTAFAKAYAQPVLSRLEKIPAQDHAAFAQAYLASMERQLLQIQEKCRSRRKGLLSFFSDRKGGPLSFVFRWKHVIDRLAHTDVPNVVATIRKAIDDNKG